jgi:hypothetical protein
MLFLVYFNTILYWLQDSSMDLFKYIHLFQILLSILKKYELYLINRTFKFFSRLLGILCLGAFIFYHLLKYFFEENPVNFAKLIEY